MKKALNWLSLLLVSTVLGVTGCVTTVSEVTAFREPALADQTYSKVGVFAQGMVLEAAVEVERQVCEKLAPVDCVRGTEVLPPIRQYTDEEVRLLVAKRNLDAVLMIRLGADQGASTYVGTYTGLSGTSQGSASTTGSVSMYGNQGLFSANTMGTTGTSGSAMSIPLYRIERQARGLLYLFDTESGILAWGGEVVVSGQGIAGTKDSAFISSASAAIADELRSVGIFAAPTQ